MTRVNRASSSEKCSRRCHDPRSGPVPGGVRDADTLSGGPDAWDRASLRCCGDARRVRSALVVQSPLRMATYFLVIDVADGAMCLVDRTGRRRPYVEAYRLAARAQKGDELAARALLAFDHPIDAGGVPIVTSVVSARDGEQSFFFCAENLTATAPSDQRWWQVAARAAAR